MARTFTPPKEQVASNPVDDTVYRIYWGSALYNARLIQASPRVFELEVPTHYHWGLTAPEQAKKRRIKLIEGEDDFKILTP